MNVYRRHFKVTEGPLVDAVMEANRINKAAREAYVKILEDIGADTSGYYQVDQRLVGILFSEDPDRNLFKKVKGGGWYPKKNSKAGRAIAERIEAVETRDRKEALELIGIPSIPTIFLGGRCYWPAMTVIPEEPPVVYVSIPWYDEDPEKLKEYKDERAAGTHRDLNYDSLCWEPTPEMEEIKEWQISRAVDEWNEKVG